MDRNGFAALILLVLIPPDVSYAFSFTNLRRLVGTEAAPNPSSSQHISPVSGPVSNNSDPKSNGAEEFRSNMTSESPVPGNPSRVEAKSSSNTGTGSPRVSELSGDEKEAQTGIAEGCDQSLNKCMDLGNMTACVLSLKSGAGSRASILVQNQGESSLNVNLAALTPAKNPPYYFEIHKHQSQRVDVSTTIGESSTVVLNSGHGNCILHVGPLISEGNHFLRLPYTQLLTPINGAYFLIVSVLIFGATWAGCKCWKRGQHGEIPYQELEMGLPESVPVSNLEAEGWDQGWDDDWEDSGKSPGTDHLINISSNGLASRSFNRDGWEKDWND